MKYVGLVELIDQSNSTNRNSSIVQMYRVRFPLFKPLPTVRLISVNSQVVCDGSPVSGPVVTDIRLEHSYWPMSHTTTSSHNPPPKEVEYTGECGEAIPVNPLMIGGRQIRPGDWPWLVAIFIVNSLGLEFHCSGILITKTFIITVGHCVLHEKGTMKPEDIFVYLGKYNLHKWNERQAVISEVGGIYVHPEYDVSKYTGDIAMIQLKAPTKFNMYIRPACLWSQAPDLNLIVGQFGTVVGWGRGGPKNELSPVPQIMQIPIVSTEDCVKSHSEFAFLTSSQTFCAGAKDGQGPCNGDSGGGLMLQVKRQNVTRWELRGLVSVSLLNITADTCDLFQYIVFTDTAKYISWINFVIKKFSIDN